MFERSKASVPPLYGAPHTALPLLFLLLFCIFHTSESVAWCISTPTTGDYTLTAGSTCTLTTQVVVDGTTLSLHGNPDPSTDFAVIQQTTKPANENGNTRLFWVRSGTLLLRDLKLIGGHIVCPFAKTLVYSFFSKCAGGLVLVGDGTATNVNGIALLNLTQRVYLGTGKACDGGALAAIGPKTVVHIGAESEIRDNVAQAFGGGLLVVGGAAVHIVDTRIEKNKAHIADGGGAFIQESFSSLTTLRTVFAANQAMRYGGGIGMNCLGCPLDNSNLFAPTDSTIVSNKARNGGGIFAWTGGLIQGRNTHVQLNIAEGKGGGLFSDESSVDLENITFSKNTAYQQGGGAYLKSTRNARIVQSAFKNNAVVGHTSLHDALFGAGMYLTDLSNNPSCSIVMEENSFVGNVARDSQSLFLCHGGGMYLSEIDTSTIQQFSMARLTFDSNVAWGAGGGLAVNNVVGVLFVGLHLLNNRASTDGGGMAITGHSQVGVFGEGSNNKKTWIDGNIAGVSEQRTPGWRAQWFTNYEGPESVLGPTLEYRSAHDAVEDGTVQAINFASTSLFEGLQAFPTKFTANFAAHFDGTLHVSMTGTYQFKVYVSLIVCIHFSSMEY